MVMTRAMEASQAHRLAVSGVMVPVAELTPEAGALFGRCRLRRGGLLSTGSDERFSAITTHQRARLVFVFFVTRIRRAWFPAARQGVTPGRRRNGTAAA